MRTILVVIGTRPEAIKLAPVVQELRTRSSSVRTVVCCTGQHRELLSQALSMFDMTVDIDLSAMVPSQRLANLAATILAGLDNVICETKPDWVVAQGDTTSVLCAAMAAFFANVRFAHVEAGLRTGCLKNPFPEEFNRRAADICASMWFAPTELSRRYLLAEGFNSADVYVTGNTVVDAIQTISRISYDWNSGPLAGVPRDARIILVTAHRRENFGEPLRQLCIGLRTLAAQSARKGVHLVCPLHLNPEARRHFVEVLGGISNVHLLEPLDYISLINLMKTSELVLTDSGGIQEEAPSFGIPVLVMRETTERPEGVEAGIARLIGTSSEKIVSEATRLLDDPVEYAAMSAAVNPYGDGRAASRIVGHLLGADV